MPNSNPTQPCPFTRRAEETDSAALQPLLGPGIHHLGLWSSDVRGEAQALVSRGCVMEVAGLADDGGVGGFALLVTPMGARFELVDTSMGPMFARWFAGGTFLE